MNPLGTIQKRNTRPVELMAVLTCFLSVISQLPFIYQNAVLKPISTAIWVVLLVVLLIWDPHLFLRTPILFPILFDIWCLFCEARTGFTMKYLNAAIFRSVNLCTFVLEVGWMLSEYYSKALLKKLAKAYLYAATIFSAVIFVEYFLGRSIVGHGYLYNAKNSAASIVLIAFVLLCVMKAEILPFRSKPLGISLGIFYVVILIYMQSRTVLLCALCALVWYLICVEKRWRVKFAILILFALAVLFVLNNETAYHTIVENILLNGKESDDLSGITSNRIDHLARFRELFPQSPFWGWGGTYLESFPLAALASFGLLGGGLLFLYMLFPIVTGIRLVLCRKDRKLGYMLIAVSITLLINGIAEELPPFGPGVKCFFMWFLAGLARKAIDSGEPMESDTLRECEKEETTV